MKVVVSVYADNIYSDWWDNPEYGDDNTAYLSLDKADLIEWINENRIENECDFDTFMSEYTHDWTEGLVEWLEGNNKHFEVLEYGECVMGLIDIRKLNAELNEMIARQDKEIERIDTEIREYTEDLYRKMVADLSPFRDVAAEIGDTIVVETMSGEKSTDSIVFYPDNRSHLGGYGNTTITATIFFKRLPVDKRERAILFDFAKKWPALRDGFQKRFEEKCVEAIKRKAEKANARYSSAVARYEHSGCGAASAGADGER